MNKVITSSTKYIIARCEEPMIEFSSVNREAYEENLRKKQEEHLKQVKEYKEQMHPWRPCMHDSCQECFGTGIKINGSMCIHMIYCQCPKCSSWCM